MKPIEKKEAGSTGKSPAIPGDTVGSRALNDPAASLIPVLARRLYLSQDDLFCALGLPRSTVSARMSRNGKLTPAEQRRIDRAGKVWSRAMEVLEDEDASRTWMTSRIRALGGVRPISLLDTEAGFGMVLDTLGRIEYGILS